jgi:putative membrane protein
MKEIPKALYHFENKEEIIFRDYLAIERTKLANERTLLSYIRTSLYLFLGAIAFFQLDGLDKIKWLAYPSVILSILSLIIGIVKYYRLKNRLNNAMTKERDLPAESKSSGRPYQ